MNEGLIQGSEEWLAARLGKATASRMADLTARIKTGYGVSRATYMAELVVERLTGQRAAKFQNEAMQWGTEKEPEARAAYEFYRGVTVTTVGFIDHPLIPMSGASPDGFVGDDGLVEIRCPQTNTHIETLLGQAVPGKYISQIQWQLACTERHWCDWISYDPRLPENMRLFTKRILRDNATIATLEDEVRKFLAEVDDTIDKLQSIYGGQ